MPTVSDALAYADRGWRVLPVPPNTKNPILPEWQLKATVDPACIKEWWAQFPDSNIAIGTGEESGIVVLDVDGELGKASLAKLIVEHGELPVTYFEHSPNGVHYFFNFPAAPIKSGTAIFPGIDLQSDKRCITVAPSVVHGKKYEVINDAPIANLPDWLISLLSPATASSNVQIDVETSEVAGFPEGERNIRTFLYACSLRAKGISLEDAEHLVLKRAKSCAPPFPTAEALTCLKSAWKYITPYELTDVGNAKRLVGLFGDFLRKPTYQKQWLVRDGAMWRTDETGTIIRRAKETVQTIATEARNVQDPDYQGTLIRHAKVSGSLRSVESMIKLAESESDIPVTAGYVDADPYLLGTLSGILNLRDQTVIETQQIVTKRIPVAFNPDATCPRWNQFLDEIFANDNDLVRYIQQAVGYSLTGRTDEQCLFFLHGNGANGKSTFLNVIRHLLGEYAVTAPPTVLMSTRGQDNAAIASMHGARFSVASEVGEDSRFDEVTVKQLTGGDPVSCRYLYDNYFTYTPQFKLWIGGNHKPQIRGTDYAIWRRIKLIPFNVTFAKVDRDLKLEQKLKLEIEGILNWAIQGCHDWRLNGLDEPASVVEATSEYRSESDIIGQFLEERCVQGDADNTTAASLLYSEYRDWCVETGNQCVTATMFGRKLVEIGLTKKKFSDTTRYLGIKLRTVNHLAQLNEAAL